jgi:hypothetical protein
MYRKLLIGCAAPLLAMSAVAACGDDGGAGSKSAGPTLTITAKEFSFDLVGTAQAGLTTVKFVNAGKEPHIVAAFKLKAGKTVNDAVPLFESEQPDAAKVAEVFDEGPSTFHGLPGLVFAGNSETTITKELQQGSYALVCFLPSPDGKSHLMQGMTKELVVAAAPKNVDALKTAGDITISDTAFATPAKMKSGTYRVVNNGKEPHQINIVRAAAGTQAPAIDKAINDYFASIGKTPTPAVPTFPFEFVGGFTDAMGPGASGIMVLDLPKGHYLIGSESDDNGVTKFNVSFDVT